MSEGTVSPVWVTCGIWDWSKFTVEDINTWGWWFLGIIHLSYIALAISQPQLCIELDKREVCYVNNSSVKQFQDMQKCI